MNMTAELERLLNTLGAAAAGDLDALEAEGRGARGVKAPADAIDAVLASADRVTAVRSLRESAAVEAFRSELTDGLIRVDTANRLLRLVNDLVVRLL